MGNMPMMGGSQSGGMMNDCPAMSGSMCPMMGGMGMGSMMFMMGLTSLFLIAAIFALFAVGLFCCDAVVPLPRNEEMSNGLDNVAADSPSARLLSANALDDDARKDVERQGSRRETVTKSDAATVSPWPMGCSASPRRHPKDRE